MWWISSWSLQFSLPVLTLKVAIFMVFFYFNKTVGTICALGVPHLRFAGSPSLITACESWMSQFSTTLVPLPAFSDGSIIFLALIIFPFSRQLNSGCAGEYYIPMQWSLTGCSSRLSSVESWLSQHYTLLSPIQPEVTLHPIT